MVCSMRAAKTACLLRQGPCHRADGLASAVPVKRGTKLSVLDEGKQAGCLHE